MTTTLLAAMIEAAMRCGAGFASTAEAGSAVQALVDAALLDTGSLQDAFAGGWSYRPNASASDRTRALPQQGSFNTQAGSLVPIRPWTVAPTAAETYQLYGIIPPREMPGQTESWKRLVNRALGNMWQVAELPVGSGIGSPNLRWFPVLRSEVMLLAAIVVAGGSAATITPPTGWLAAGSIVNLSTTLQLALFTHRARPNDPVEWTWTLDSSRVATGAIIAYIDPNPTAPIDVYASATASAAATITTPSVTTSYDQETVLRVVAAGVPLTWTPAGQSQQRRLDATLENGNANQGLAIFDATQPTAAAAGSNVLTASQAANQIAITIAFARKDSTHRVLFSSGSIGFTAAAGATSLDLSRPVNVPNDEWLPGVADARACFVRRYTSLENGQFLGQPYDYDMNTRGRWWKLHEDNGQRYLEVSPWTTRQGDSVILQVQRPFMPLVADNDETACPLEVLVLRTRYELYSYLNSAPATRGKYSVELAQALDDWQREYRTIAPQQAVIGA